MQVIEKLESALRDARGLRRADLLIELCPFVGKVDPARARTLAEEALELAGRGQDELRSGRALQALGIVELDAGGGLVTIRNLLAARRMFDRCESDPDLADVHRNLALAYTLAGNVAEAGEALEEAGRRLGKDPVRTAKFENNAGIYEAVRNDPAAAEGHLRRALELAVANGIDTVAQSASNNLGTLYLHSDRPAEAFELFEAALASSRRIGTTRGLAAARVNGGQCLAMLDRVPEAREWLTEGLELATELGIRHIIEAAHVSLGTLAKDEGDDRTAARHCEVLAELRRQIMQDWMASGVPRAKAEDDALRAEEKYRSAQRMEMVARITGGAAHDFNNVLSAIRGYAVLATEARSEEARARALAQIRAAAERGAELTGQLLNFARAREDRTETTDLNEAVSSTERMLRPLLPSALMVELELDPDVPAVGVDSSSMKQVIMNLIVNARDAMPWGGTLTIRTELRSPEGTILTVKDDGSGMDPATLSRIFEPLFTTKPAEQGTGLGLSTVKDILDEAGGRIEVGSEVDVGTTFTVFLPPVPTD